MKEKALSGLKILAGVGVGLIAAELVAIGSNAAFDDIDYMKESIGKKLNPEPEPKKSGFFKKK